MAGKKSAKAAADPTPVELFADNLLTHLADFLRDSGETHSDTFLLIAIVLEAYGEVSGQPVCSVEELETFHPNLLDPPKSQALVPAHSAAPQTPHKNATAADIFKRLREIGSPLINTPSQQKYGDKRIQEVADRVRATASRVEDVTEKEEGQKPRVPTTITIESDSDIDPKGKAARKKAADKKPVEIKHTLEDAFEEMENTDPPPEPKKRGTTSRSTAASKRLKKANVPADDDSP